MKVKKVALTRRIEETKVLHIDEWAKVSLSDVHFDNGNTITDFLLVKIFGNGYVAVCSRLSNGRFLFVRQCRPVSEMSIELIAGGCPDGIIPEEQVLEEMIAETGYKPGRLIRINKFGFFTQNDRIENRCHLFLAFDCVPTSEIRKQDEKQGVDVIILTPQEVLQKIKNGEIKDIATLAGIFAHFTYEVSPALF